MRLNFWSMLLIAAVVFCIAFAAAPWFAFRALRSAAQNQDVQALGQLVDYPAVRASLRSQVRPTMAAQIPAPSVWQDPMGALRHALEQPVLQQPPQVDRLLTPAALARMTLGRMPDDPRPPAGKAPFPTYVYWDMGRARMAVADPSTPGGRNVFTFERVGIFQWRLVQVRLPRQPSA